MESALANEIENHALGCLISIGVSLSVEQVKHFRLSMGNGDLYKRLAALAMPEDRKVAIAATLQSRAKAAYDLRDGSGVLSVSLEVPVEHLPALQMIGPGVVTITGYTEDDQLAFDASENERN